MRGYWRSIMASRKLHRRTWKIAANVSDATRKLVYRAADHEGVSAAALVRRGAIREAERVLEGQEDG